MWREKLVCRSIGLTDMAQLIDELGGNSADLMQEVGLNPDLVKQGKDYVSWVAICKLLENVADRFDVPDFGLRWALALKPDFANIGPVVFISALVPNVRRFTELAIHNQHIHTNGHKIRLIENEVDGVLHVIFDINPAAPNCRQYAEHVIRVNNRMREELLPAPQYQCLGVKFQHKNLMPEAAYVSLFGCPVEFNSERTEVLFPLAILDEKMGLNFKLGRKGVEIYLANKLKKASAHGTSIAAMLAGLLPSILGVRKSDVGSIAEVLGMSPKKMQRLLQDEGTTYSKVLDETRKGMATRALQDSNISIGRISQQLDYTSSIAFRNACKRWTGLSPRAYRQSKDAKTG